MADYTAQNGVRGAQVVNKYPPFSIVGVREGVVIEVHYTDQPSNKSKQFVEYDVRDLVNGQVYTAVRRLGATGEIDGGTEDVLVPASRIVNSIELFDKYTTANLGATNGDRVLLAFVNGAYHSAVILGVLPHARRTAGQTTTFDGHRRFSVHEGTNFEIKKDGTYVISRTLPTGVVSLTLSPDGTYVVEHPSGSKLTVNTDGSIELDGAGNSSIRIGAGATESVVRGDSFKSTFDALVGVVNTFITLYNAHTHDPVTGVLNPANAVTSTASSMPSSDLSDKAVVE